MKTTATECAISPVLMVTVQDVPATGSGETIKPHRISGNRSRLAAMAGGLLGILISLGAVQPASADIVDYRYAEDGTITFWVTQPTASTIMQRGSIVTKWVGAPSNGYQACDYLDGVLYHGSAFVEGQPRLFVFTVPGGTATKRGMIDPSGQLRPNHVAPAPPAPTYSGPSILGVPFPGGPVISR